MDGIPVVLDGYIVACGCPTGRNRAIAANSTFFCDDGTNSSPSFGIVPSGYNNVLPDFSKLSQNEKNEQRAQIRFEKNKFITDTTQMSNSLFYFLQTKQEFKNHISQFAKNVADKVENERLSYEEGSVALTEHKKALLDESIEWTQRGISVLAGTSQIVSGVSACKNWVTCLFYSLPSATHGMNNIYEGIINEDGLVKKGYRGIAEFLGYEAIYGDIAYNTVDLGLSAYSMFSLISKLNQFGNKNLSLWYHNQQDMVRAYQLMCKTALGLEVIADSFTIGALTKQLYNAFIVNKKTEEAVLFLKDPSQIKNAEDMLNCPVVVINGNKFAYCENVK